MELSPCGRANPPPAAGGAGVPALNPSGSVVPGSDREDWMGLSAKLDWASTLNAAAIVASLCLVGAIVFGIL